MKRYLLLVGSNYYPAGWSDFKGSFDSVEQAQAAASTDDGQWAEVVDTETCELVREGDSHYSAEWDWFR